MYELFDYRVICILREINKRIEDRIEQDCREFGLTYAQAMILLNLYMTGAQSITGLSESMCSVKGNISPICKRLESNGYIRRWRDESDQRKLTVELTHSARELIREKLLDPAGESCPQSDKDEILKGLQMLQEYLSGRTDPFTDH